MENQFQQQQQNNMQPKMQSTNQMSPQNNFGAHELFDVREATGHVVACLEHSLLYEQHIQDPELSSILQRQKSFLTQLYNTIVDTISSGTDPQVPTQSYMMEQNNNVTYGISPSQPKTPAQSMNEINDECISSFMMGHLKAAASSFTVTALESANPVSRRVFADSVPNLIEMAYELFLYQNKHQYYQLPQLDQQDMHAMLNTYGPMQGNMNH